MRAALAFAASLALCAAAAIPGGFMTIDVSSDAEAKQALEFAASEMNARSNALNKFVVVSVLEARQQIVAGVKYQFTIEGGLSSQCQNDANWQTADECPVPDEGKKRYVLEVLVQIWKADKFTLLAVSEIEDAPTNSDEPQETDDSGDPESSESDTQPCDIMWSGYSARAGGNGCEWVMAHGCDNPIPFKTEEDCLASLSSGETPSDAPDNAQDESANADGPQLCQIVFTGYEFDPDQSACVQKTFRGCVNPFPFVTLEQCQAASAPSPAPCLVQVSGWEYSANSDSCIQRTVIDCSSEFPFEYQSENACLADHPARNPGPPIGGATNLDDPHDGETWRVISFAVRKIQSQTGDRDLVFLRLVEGQKQLASGVYYTFVVELAHSSACALQQVHRLRTASDCPVDKDAAVITYNASVTVRPWSHPKMTLTSYTRSSSSTNPSASPCMIVWRGYVFNMQTQECEESVAHGCENPFQHLTAEECESSNGVGVIEIEQDNASQGHVQHASYTFWIFGGVAVGAIAVCVGAMLYMVRRRRNVDRSFYDLLQNTDEKPVRP